MPEISAAFHEIFLILAVRDLTHPLDQQPVTIVLDEAVPIGSPDALDDVPSRAAENSFQFLNDLAIAAHRPVEPLQVAVHHEDEIVQPFPRSQCD